MTTNQIVRFDQHAMYIRDTPAIVLCGSLFYFRIPHALWQDRLQKIKAAGYNAIDVYFPWNYHELVEGGWDFSGERDVETFLQLAVNSGLWIVARPGPYICSEWDGGALPGFLQPHRKMRLRDNDPNYLRYVEQWFARIFPILEKFQVTPHGGPHGGPQGGIILIQLENELDFFDCDDRTGYMTALWDLARQYDLRVPLIACAGQGDLSGATGNVAGITPTGNFYPDLLDPGIEAKVSFYRQQVERQQIPLMVTETHRAHFHLRRLLSCGVKLLGPYNQVAGTDFGFTNAVNNWGAPVALMTSEYDFDSMISSTGALREEFFEARLLAGFIQAFGASLAQAAPLDTGDIELCGGLTAPDGGPYGLTLADGGWMLALSNLTAAPIMGTLRMPEMAFPKYSSLTIPPQRCPFVVGNIALECWHCAGTLVYASAEIGRVLVEQDRTILALYTDQVGEVALALPEDVEIEADGMTMHVEPSCVTCCFTSERISQARIRYQDGRRLDIFGMSRTHASHVEGVTPQNDIVWHPYATAIRAREEPRILPAPRWTAAEISESGGGIYHAKIACNSTAKYLEEVGILRGYGWYGAQINLEAEQPVLGFLAHAAADVLSLYVNGVYQGTAVPGGGAVFFPAQNVGAEQMDALARTEIWGHSNFDDVRLPALRLKSMRGLGGLTAVAACRDISKNWRFRTIRDFSEEIMQACLRQDAETWNVLDWAAWMTARHPHRACFRKQICTSSQANAWTLHFPDTHFRAQVFVNGRDLGLVNPHDPFVRIPSSVKPGESLDVAVFTEQAYGTPGGVVRLYEGVSATNWWIGAGSEADFADAARNAFPQGTPIALPCRLAAGEVRWLFGQLPDIPTCQTLTVTGQNVKITALFNDRLVGRLWLPSGDLRPAMRGGMTDNRVYLPGPWFKEKQNRVALYVEAVGLTGKAEITNMALAYGNGVNP